MLYADTLVRTRLGNTSHAIRTVFYADDFCVFTTQESDIARVKAAVEQWLRGVGLEIHPEKTKISYTLKGQPGFDFLGFEIRQYPVGKYASKRGFKTLIMPSQQSEKRHRAQLKQVASHHTAAIQSKLIGQLNLVIRGWCQYFSMGVSKASFASQSAHLFRQLWQWTKRRHANLNSHQIADRYWLVHEGRGWTFQSKDGRTLLRHDQIPIRRHVKVQAHLSPYDGD